MIIELKNKNIYENLSIEEFLFDNFEPPILIFWRSTPCVVLGKNQNPWIECNLKEMIDDDIKLARRISGGGTVYHDEGNLNYSIIEDNKTYNSNKIYKMILDALKNLNIRAQIKSQNSLFYNGKKFSGTAFAYKRNKVLHHGTLLLDSDLKKLNKYLNNTDIKIKTKAVKSNSAEVTNLNLPFKSVTNEIIKQYSMLFNDVNLEKNEFNDKTIKKYIDLRSSKKWIYAKTPKFSILNKGREIEVSKENIKNISSEFLSKFVNIEKMFS